MLSVAVLNRALDFPSFQWKINKNWIQCGRGEKCATQKHLITVWIISNWKHSRSQRQPETLTSLSCLKECRGRMCSRKGAICHITAVKFRCGRHEGTYLSLLESICVALCLNGQANNYLQNICFLSLCK